MLRSVSLHFVLFAFLKKRGEKQAITDMQKKFMSMLFLLDNVILLYDSGGKLAIQMAINVASLSWQARENERFTKCLAKQVEIERGHK